MNYITDYLQYYNINIVKELLKPHNVLGKSNIDEYIKLFYKKSDNIENNTKHIFAEINKTEKEIIIKTINELFHKNNMES